MRQSLKYALLGLFAIVGGLLATIAVIFLFSVAIPLPLTDEQRAEISTYAPEEDGWSAFQTEFWRAGHNPNITVTEIITIRRQGNQITVNRYWFPYMSWGITRTIRERQLKQRMEAETIRL